MLQADARQGRRDRGASRTAVEGNIAFQPRPCRQRLVPHRALPLVDAHLMHDIAPAQNGIFEPFVYQNEHFAKTGSGQT